MEAAFTLRPFNYSAGGISHARSSLEWPDLTSKLTVVRSNAQAFAGRKLTCSVRKAGISVSAMNTPEPTVSSKADAVAVDSEPKGSRENLPLQSATFPNAFEALVLEVCDETSVAELHLKVGDFEMHLKRNIGAANVPIHAAPCVPTETMVQSASAAPSTSAPKTSPAKANLFALASPVVSSMLASLEASGTADYKLVTSPTVGSFRRGRTMKGKKKPPACKQGDVIKEGQVIGYIDQFGTELPVKSDLAGEVLKLLFNEGEAVGYGDPLVAILPLSRGLN